MQRLIVISIDALTDEDLRKAGNTPNINSLIERGTYIREIEGIYPSLTHPCHSTIITGKTPGEHGVISNTDYSKPGHPWFNSLSDLKCPSVIDVFKENGATVASCRWPVTADGFDRIDYLIPEITDESVLENGCLEHYTKISSPALHPIIRKNIHLLSGKDQPQEDLFSTACCVDIIKTHKPTVLLTHPACVDTYKHRTGIESSETMEMVALADRMVGDLIDATKEAGTYSETVFVVLSDHGHAYADKEIALNEIFRRDGMLGKLISDECCHSAQIYTDGISDEDALSYLMKKAEDESNGIERIFTKDELKRRYGTFGSFSFMVESSEGVQFSNNTDCPIETMLTVDDHHGHSTHGHMPEKSPKPIFIASGPGIAHKRLESESMLKEAPTLLKILDIDSPDLDEPIGIFL